MTNPNAKKIPPQQQPGTRKHKTRDDAIRKLVEQDPEKAAQLLRQILLDK